MNFKLNNKNILILAKQKYPRVLKKIPNYINMPLKKKQNRNTTF